MSHAITIKLEGDGAWPDLVDKKDKIIHLGDDAHAEIAALAGGMVGGAPSVALRLDLPDGRIVFYELSLKMLLTVADAFKARYGDPRG